MIRNKKNLLILLIMTLTFFTGINKVSASLSCYYKLPFVGINNSGTYIKGDDFNCTYGSTIDCSAKATINNNGASYNCSRSGANKKEYSWYHLLNRWNDTDIVIYGTNSLDGSYSCSNIDCPTNGERMYVTNSSTECPRFLVLHNSTKKSNKVWLTSLLDTDDGEDCYGWFGNRCNHSMSPETLNRSILDEEKWDCSNDYLSKTEFKSKMYTISNSEDEFKKYLESFSTEASKYDGIYLPLYNSSDNKTGSTNFNNIQANLKAFRDVTSDSWEKELNSYETKLKNACGNDWYQYINRKNYKKTYTTSANFIAYGKKKYNSSNLASYDENISEDCWNTRKDFFSMFESFGIFMYSIGANTNSSTDDQEPFYRSYTSSDSTEAAAKKWIRMEYFFKAVKNGVDTKPSEYKSSNERAQTKADSEQAVIDCKEALTRLQSSGAPAEGIKRKQEECDKLEEEDKKLAETNTYQFSAADLLRFEIKPKRYEPRCKDVSFLTSIWSVIIILAPFLLIIYSAFDYFKVVMAGDEEKMRVSRKKVPRRLIALVILLIFPQILKMLVTTFGTHRADNTKYLKCIITGDKGENESDEEDEDAKQNEEENE